MTESNTKNDAVKLRSMRTIIITSIVGGIVLVVVSYVWAIKSMQNRARQKRAELRAKYVKPFAPKVSEENPEKYFKEAAERIERLFGKELGDFNTDWYRYGYTVSLPQKSKDTLVSRSNKLISILLANEDKILELIKKAQSLYKNMEDISTRENSRSKTVKAVSRFLRLGILTHVNKNPEKTIEYLDILLDQKIHYLSDILVLYYQQFISLAAEGQVFTASLLSRKKYRNEAHLLKLRGMLAPRFSIDQLKCMLADDVMHWLEWYDDMIARAPTRYFHYRRELLIYELLQQDLEFVDGNYYDRLNTSWSSSLANYVKHQTSYIFIPYSPQDSVRAECFFKHYREYLARSRTLVLAVDVLLARKKLGRLPKDLAEIETTLGITVPNDPFSATDKIKYEITSDGFKTGSCGTGQKMSFEIKLPSEESKE